MATFLTGATGFIGSYVAHELLSRTSERLAVLVRAKSIRQAQERLWQAFQLHVEFDAFARNLGRIDIYLGDLTQPELGLEPRARQRLVESIDSVLHVAASLNRKSAKACLNVNLRGTLAVIKLARAAQDHHGLRRFSDVSTVAVAGVRSHETITEDEALEWDRSDYDPYARTKKFCEHMIHELLPEVPSTVFRPASVIGDSRFAATTQFDMVMAFVAMAYMRVLPLDPEARIDIVPADWVGRAIVHVHTAAAPRHGIYHLSAGDASPTYRQIQDALRAAGHRPRALFVPRLHGPFNAAVSALTATPAAWGVSRPASLLKVFLPYMTFDTVFDNRRIVAELGETPVPFPQYAYPLLRYAVNHRFKYPYVPWPHDAEARLAAVA